MNSRSVIVLFFLLFATVAQAQVRDEMLLKRADQGKEGINPEEIVNFKNDVDVAQALSSLSELAKKFTNKPVVFDPQFFKDKKIGVDIVKMPWRTALETILRSNGLWYQEEQEYFQLVSPQGTLVAPQMTQQPVAGQPQGTQSLGTMMGAMIPVDSAEVLAKTREITISTVFLEINSGRLRESGINFSFFRSSTSDLSYRVDFKAADNVSSDIFGITANTATGQLDVDVESALKIFEANNLGEIIARPQVTVRSGFPGRVQVGEDFSVKQRTISGDVTEQFYSTGSILEVTPKVYSYKGVDFVDIILSVERSSVIDISTSRIARNKATTRLLLLDGEEGYVGGLILQDHATVRSGIPFLKDLPWWVFGLRYVFGYDRDEIVNKELIVLLRAEIMPTPEERVTQKAKNIIEDRLKQGRNEIKKKSQMDKN